MSVTNIHIPPILAESTPGGFVRAARRLPQGIEWQGGVTFTPSCGGAERAGCSYGVDVWTVEDKADPVEFDPFLIGASLRCSGAPDQSELRTLVQGRMARGMSGQFARELHTSTADVGNPDLFTTATDITPVTPPCINHAIAGLMSAADDCGGGELTFHIPLVAAGSLMTYDLLEFVDGRYRLGGHSVIVDAYPNLPPSGGAAPGADQAWIWATGPVEYAVSENVAVEHFQDRQNESVVIGQREAILRFDTCCVYGILADIC